VMLKKIRMAITGIKSNRWGKRGEKEQVYNEGQIIRQKKRKKMMVPRLLVDVEIEG